MKKILATAAILLCSLAATLVATDSTPRGPEVVFTGFVISAETGHPLEAARVSVEGTPHSTLTGPDGDYTIQVLRETFTAATARLLTSRIGYGDATAEVDIAADTVRTDFRLPAVTLEHQEMAAIGMADAAAVQSASARVGNLVAPPPATPGYSAGLAPGLYPPGWNREAYGHIVENAFQSVDDNPLSTFSIDVDRASYSNVRRFLLDRQMPPTDAVRIEEMVNYFSYDYPTPRGDDAFAIATEIAPAPWHAEHQLLRISLATTPVETTRLPASNLVFLLDVSGSMNSPDKLPLVKRSLRLLVNELRPRDRVAIVVYAGAAGLVLPSTSGEEKARILGAIEALEAGGSTAGGAGLRLAYRIARENHIEGGNNRVILATDGDFNVGESSDSEMIRLVERMRGEGAFLTVLGFGTGNLQDSKMEQIANHGNGNYAYIDSFLEARKVLVNEMGGTLLTVAKDVKLQVEFNPAKVRGYRLIGYENRLLAAEDFNDDAKDAGELGAGHTVTALYEIVPVGADSDLEIRGTDPLRYQRRPAPGGNANGEELAFVRVRYKHPDSDRSELTEQPVRASVGNPSTDLRFASAVAGFGMLLRESEHRGSITPDNVITIARAARGEDREGYRQEFIHLVELYRSMTMEER
jgi:Ca-activated chloride channel family protein